MRRGLGLLLTARLVELFGALLMLARDLIALDHLRLDLHRLRIARTRSLAEVHEALGIGPAIDLRRRQHRHQQGTQQ
ncbi:hypothetical protein D3C84_1033290 [compost metagenome]